MVSGTRDNPPSELPWPRQRLAYFFAKFNQPFTLKNANSSREARQLGWACFLLSASRVTLACGTTFLHINALARLPRTALGVESVTKCQDFGFKAEIRSKEVKIHSAKHTVIG